MSDLDLCGALVVLLGIDGSGKSSVLRGLRELQPDWAYASIDPVELYPLPGLDYMDWALTTPPRRYIARWGELSRASFLTHVLSLCYEERVLPPLADGRTVVCDSYYYRVLAKEQTLGSAGMALVTSLAASMRSPDLTIWLDVDPDTAWRRNRGQCGRYEAIGHPDLVGFRLMQEAVRRLILGGGLGNVPLHRIDGMAPLVQVVSDVRGAIAAHAVPSSSATEA